LGANSYVAAALEGGGVAAFSDIANAIENHQSVDWSAVLTDAVRGAFVGLLLNTETVDGFISSDAKPLAGEVAKWAASGGIAAVMLELRLLVSSF